jgi:hypothetical protein
MRSVQPEMRGEPIAGGEVHAHGRSVALKRLRFDASAAVTG